MGKKLKKMSRADLLATLIAIKADVEEKGDPESDHCHADDALLAYIGDPEIIEAFEAIEKWYA